jgi:hypothetical protein
MRRVALACVLALTACGGAPSSDGPDARPTGGGDAGGGGQAYAGELVVLSGGGYGRLWFPPVVFGSIWGDAPPSWHTEVARAGDCRVLSYEPGFCTACEGLCLDPDRCVPWPDYLSAGTVTIRGVAGGDLALEPELDRHYQTWGGLSDPLFAAGADISVAAEGDAVASFAVAITAQPQLTVPAFDDAGQALLADGADLELTWPAPVDGARVHLFAHSGGAPHGIPPEIILECDASDTGSLTIASSLLDALPALGNGCRKGSDCASLGVMRYARAVAQTDRGAVAVTVGNGANYELVSE